MTVLHVDTGRTWRGGQVQVYLLAQALRARGIDQRFLARGELLARLRAEGFAASEAGLWAVRGTAADVVHAHDARAHTWAAIAGRRPLAVARRVAFAVKSGWLSRWKYARADRYLAVSRYVAGKLAEAGVEAARIRVVYDGAEPLRAPVEANAGLIVAPASDDPRKGSVIARECGLPVCFSADLAADLPRARAFLYLTHEEGLGSAVLLAQSAGVPVVASRVGGLPEIVEHEETGLLTENDPREVRAALERLERDPALAQRLAAEARARFAARFTAERMADATLAVYREIVVGG
ncbi:MAG: glycosyltransferase family 4 protein [Bryobacterales bacterium]|nr:glycosyltransferase family 4 protein [Bryobacterales bacterium]